MNRLLFNRDWVLLPLARRLRWLMGAGMVCCARTDVACAGEIIQVNEGDLQLVIDSAASNAVVHCDPNLCLTLSAPVVIRKPLTLVGLHARLPEKLGKVSLLVVEAKGVTITDFELTGNADSVPQSDRAPLMVIHAGDFRVERGLRAGRKCSVFSATIPVVGRWRLPSPLPKPRESAVAGADPPRQH